MIFLVFFRYERCHCCRGPMYGPGLRVIRPVSHVFKIHNLPIMFQSCSPECMSDFKKNQDDLTDFLYGDSWNSFYSSESSMEDSTRFQSQQNIEGEEEEEEGEGGEEYRDADDEMEEEFTRQGAGGRRKWFQMSEKVLICQCIFVRFKQVSGKGKGE